MWKPNEIVTFLIAHTSLRVFSRKDWYFDSGYSRHLIGEKNYPEELKLFSNIYVTFDYVAIRKIRGIGKLIYIGFPSLYDVFASRRIASFISISQLCDQGQEVLLKDSRSKEKFYIYVSALIMCNIQG